VSRCTGRSAQRSYYEDYGGSCHFTHDLPPVLPEQFGGREIQSVATMLDEKMADGRIL
jgi:hypothetical protein